MASILRTPGTATRLSRSLLLPRTALVPASCYTTTIRHHLRPAAAAVTRPGLNRRINTNLQARAMSSSSDPARPAITTPPPGKFEFLIVVPDKPGMQAKRLEVRPKHFAGLQPFMDSGVYKAGGAVLNEVPPEGVTDASQWSFAGSTLIMLAESAEACRDVLRQDIYATSGVWDVDNAQIMPVKLAFRYP